MLSKKQSDRCSKTTVLRGQFQQYGWIKAGSCAEIWELLAEISSVNSYPPFDTVTQIEQIAYGLSPR